MKQIVSKILTSNRITSIDRILHIADVHIRNYKRHDEYQIVFDRLYEYCRKVVDSEPNTLIYLAGDIVHAKTDMSPELVSMTRKFISTCVDIAPTILIPGNHDCSLSNLNRLDALSPIVDAINNDELYYLKETGIYHLAGIDFIHNSIYDKPEDFIKANEVDGDYTKIVLFHGAVDRSFTDHGMQMKNNRITVDLFSGYDFGMFGDIHSFQYLDPNARIAYAGSLIQQNFGEGLVHGILDWDIVNKKSKFIPIKNDWGYHTLDIDDGKIQSKPQTFSKYNRIRVKAYNTSNSELTKIISELKSEIKVNDIRIQKLGNRNSGTGNESKMILQDVRDIEYQNQLIIEHLGKNYVIDDDTIDEIRKINRNLNTQIAKSAVLRNVIWEPIKFEFENMFSYGEGNSIDFTGMNGTYGLFAANASGKSSILDALMFCIFDKCSRTYKASQVMNNKKDSFYCKFSFNLGGREFFIERVGKKDKKGHVKVNVEFWYEEDGQVVSLNGDDRDSTNLAIRNYLGTYDDFIITTLSLQGNNTNFIDKQQRERKDLLSQFLDLNLFEELNGLATEEIKGVQTLIKEFSKYDYSSKIADANDNLIKYNEELSQLTKNKAEYSELFATFTDEILGLTKKLKPIDEMIDSIDIEKSILSKDAISTMISKIQSEITLTEKNRQELLSSKEVIETELLGYNSEELESSVEKYHELDKKLLVLSSDISNTKFSIDHYASKIDKLSTHEYDPNCKYCVNNEFVKDAIDAKELLEAAIKQLEIQDKEYSEILSIRDSLSDSLKLKKEESDLKTKLQSVISDIVKIESGIRDYQSNLVRKETELSELETKITRYFNNEASIKENHLIQLDISDIETKKESIVRKLRPLEQRIIDVSGQIKVYEMTLNECVSAIRKLKELEKEYLAYDYYMKAVNRNGVPYDLISLTIPKIQNEVNSIISQIVDFEILFETDGKSINTYIVYDDENYWPLEMTSGMEKFISSLAIRTALVNISSLPRPNFIAIDEGWGTLDSDNLNSLHGFFEYLKTHFNFILTVSHIDVLRDIVDSVIDIHKQNGFSQIQY